MNDEERQESNTDSEALYHIKELSPQRTTVQALRVSSQEEVTVQL